jgi:RNA-directed DNA polymerase
MNGREKSDSAEVAVKPANKTGMPAAEQVEPRAGTEGNAIPQSTSRTQGRADASQARDRIRVAARRNKWPSDRFRVKHPRWEPYAGIPPVRI